MRAPETCGRMPTRRPPSVRRQESQRSANPVGLPRRSCPCSEAPQATVGRTGSSAPPTPDTAPPRRPTQESLARAPDAPRSPLPRRHVSTGRLPPLARAWSFSPRSQRSQLPPVFSIHLVTLCVLGVLASSAIRIPRLLIPNPLCSWRLGVLG